jgi:hypothetical protein
MGETHPYIDVTGLGTIDISADKFKVGIIYKHFDTLNNSSLTLSQFSGLFVVEHNRLIINQQEIDWALERIDQVFSK